MLSVNAISHLKNALVLRTYTDAHILLSVSGQKIIKRTIRFVFGKTKTKTQKAFYALKYVCHAHKGLTRNFTSIRPCHVVI